MPKTKQNKIYLIIGRQNKCLSLIFSYSFIISYLLYDHLTKLSKIFLLFVQVLVFFCELTLCKFNNI